MSGVLGGDTVVVDIHHGMIGTRGVMHKNDAAGVAIGVRGQGPIICIGIKILSHRCAVNPCHRTRPPGCACGHTTRFHGLGNIVGTVIAAVVCIVPIVQIGVLPNGVAVIAAVSVGASDRSGIAGISIRVISRHNPIILKASVG